MSTIITIARREIAGFFYSPIAYLVLFLFLVFVGILFGLFVFVPGQVTEMRTLFDFSRFGLFFIIPLLTMSLFSDEYRSGRMEMLRTSPITEAQLVLGKYLGAMAFYVVLVASTLIFLLLLVIFGRPDYGAVFASYIGMLLLGALFVSIGLFFSACTQNQLVAALSALIVLAALTLLGDLLAPRLPESIKILGLPLYLRQVVFYLGVGSHMQDFAKGVIDTAHAAYFLLGTGFFLFLTYLVLESRKWR
ncbi:MAG: ABC transporter permease [Phycisphaerae bacterium]